MAFKLKYQGKGANPIMSKIGYSKIDGKYQYKPSILKQDEVVNVEETPGETITTYGDWKLTQDGMQEVRDVTEKQIKNIKGKIKGFETKRTDPEAYSLYLKNMGLPDTKENRIRYRKEAQEWRDTQQRLVNQKEADLKQYQEFRPVVVEIPEKGLVTLTTPEEVAQYEQDYGTRETKTHKMYTDVTYDKKTGETKLRDSKGKIIEGIRDFFLPSYRQAALGTVERGGDEDTETTSGGDIDPTLLPAEDVSESRAQIYRRPSTLAELFGAKQKVIERGTGGKGTTGDITAGKIEGVEIQQITNPELSEYRRTVVRDDQGNLVPNPDLSSSRYESTLDLLNKAKNNPINKKLPRAYQSIKNLKR